MADRSAGGECAVPCAVVLRLRETAPEALGYALQEVINRHEVLRR